MVKSNWRESKSALVKQALGIASDIAKMVESDGFSTVPYVSVGRVETLRGYVRDLIRDQDWKDRVLTAVDGGVLFVHVKEISRVERLEKMLFKALNHIDDEHLYDEIMEVLHGNG